MKITGFFVGNPFHSKPVKAAKKTHRLLSVAPLFINPMFTFGATSSDQEVISAILNLADYLCQGVLIFAGASWSLGNRTNALNYIIGGCSGYLLIRKSGDIRDWLKEL